MKNLDILQRERGELLQKLQLAVKDGNEDGFAEAFTAFADNIQQQVMAEAHAALNAHDVEVLSARGVRQLTSEETSYFQRLGDAMRSANPKQALADLDVVMPKTTIDAIFDDLTGAHPLLSAITFQNTSGLIEMYVNTHEDQLGTWSPLTAEITKELTSGFKKVQLALSKYTAFIPVAKAMLDLGPAWLDRYVRTILQETVYLGLEEAIIKGTGKDMPIGMIRQVGDGVTVTGGVYPEKTPVPVTSLDPVAYGKLLADMSLSPNNHQRTIDNVILVVSPKDYFNKIMPATTIRGADGRYVSDVLPFPTTVIQSVQVPENRMIVGLARRYFMGVGTAQSGRIEYSDEYRFLEDERVYTCRLYGHGEPLDNRAFAYCDITNLEPAVQQVTVKGTVRTKADSSPSA